MKTKQQIFEDKVRRIVKEELMNEDATQYYKNELAKVDINSEYYPICKIKSGEADGQTKNFNINLESIPVLITWLKMVQKKQLRQQKTNV